MKRPTFLLFWCATMGLFLLGCEKMWRLTILGEHGHYPVMCFSAKDAPCGEAPVYFTFVEVVEVDRRGHAAKQAWAIDCSSCKPQGEPLGMLEYGKPPQHWRERTKAMPIKDNVYYEVNGRQYFIRDPAGKYSVLTPREFYADAK